MPSDVILIEGDTVVLVVKGQDGDGISTLKEKKRVALSSLLPLLHGKVVEPRNGINTPVLPRETRYYGRNGKRQAVVLEQLPQVRTLLWEDFGDDGIQLSLPYVVYIFYFEDNIIPTYKSRLFFRNEPLLSLDDHLFYSFMTHVNDGSTEGVGGACFRSTMMSPFRGTVAEQIEKSLNYYWSTQFRNFEGRNNWQGGQQKTRRANILSGVREWEKLSRENPASITTLKWIDTGVTVNTIITEMLGDRAERDDDREQKVKPVDIDSLVDLIMRIR